MLSDHECKEVGCAHPSHGNGGSWTYRKGLTDLGGGVWAYLLPDGSWGWSNAGFITSQGQSLLVDTLFDERLTGDMLDAIKTASNVDRSDIGTVVNTHANADHTFGNGLVKQAEIITSQASFDEMADFTPEDYVNLLRNADTMGDAGRFFLEKFGQFDFAGVDYTVANSTFSGRKAVQVGDYDVELIEVGPAHTKGDVIAYVPAAKTVFTGDILFVEGTPIVWAGPVSNWLAAIDLICDLDVDVIVPGHGPITDKSGARKMGEYLQVIDKETRARFDAGMDEEEATFDIALGEFASWGEAERLAGNVAALYREYRGDTSAPDIIALLDRIARLERRGPRH